MFIGFTNNIVWWNEYLVVIISMGVAGALSMVLFLISYFLVPRQLNLEKISVYECGFDPFQDSRGKFEVRFYLVAILFIVFDLEVSFLFPWSVIGIGWDLFSFSIMIFFLFVLTIGFVYEWLKGALDWIKYSFSENWWGGLEGFKELKWGFKISNFWV